MLRSEGSLRFCIHWYFNSKITQNTIWYTPPPPRKKLYWTHRRRKQIDSSRGGGHTYSKSRQANKYIKKSPNKTNYRTSPVGSLIPLLLFYLVKIVNYYTTQRWTYCAIGAGIWMRTVARDTVNIPGVYYYTCIKIQCILINIFNITINIPLFTNQGPLGAYA